MSDSLRMNHESKLADALVMYQRDSNNADAIIWLGRRKAYLGLYNDAIEVYGKGIALYPADARFYRHRGHRYITLRCFDKAIADFEKAAELIKDKPDEIEPDGLPNARNIPTGTLQSNIWYHLGLAYFLKGEHAKAETSYRKGLAVSNNDDMAVAMTNWLYITLLSQDKLSEAKSVFTLTDRYLELIENEDYTSILYFYLHEPADDEIERYTKAVINGKTPKNDSTSVRVATLYFGAGYYAYLKKMPQKARLFFEKALATGQWSSFGYIAAETELKKLVK